MKFTKQGDEYVCGKFRVAKHWRGRQATYSSLEIGSGRLLSEAKSICEKETRMAELDALVVKKAGELASVALKEEAKANTERQRVATLEIAAKSVEFDKAWGIPWHTWAELRVGCTAGELAGMQSKQNADGYIKQVDDIFDDLECEDAEPTKLQELFNRLGKMVNTDTLKEWIEYLIEDNDIKIGSTDQFEKEIAKKTSEIEDLDLEVEGLEATIEELTQELKELKELSHENA